MIDLIRKRHPGDGWIVFEELANSTGARVRGWADAAALGVWPSSRYELHGYEIKISREDLKREIRNPSKADNIGRYCHHWWLVISDKKLMEGLVIPRPWGILVPRNKILRVVRPSPRTRNPRAFDAGFCAAMIRNIVKGWVPKHEHASVREAGLSVARAEVEAEVRRNASDEERQLRDLRDKVERFKVASGVDIQGHSLWELGHVGRALKAVVRAHRALGNPPSVAEVVRHEAEAAARRVGHHQEAARVAAAAARQMNDLARRLEVDGDEALKDAER